MPKTVTGSSLAGRTGRVLAIVLLAGVSSVAHAVSITQSVDTTTIMDGMTPVCEAVDHPPHHYWRLFDLDQDHGLTGVFCTESVDYGIDVVNGPGGDVTVNVYCLDDGLDFLLSNLQLVGTAVQTIRSGTNNELFNVGVSGCCDSGTMSMAVELVTPDCQPPGTCDQFYIGFNNLGQTAPSYLTVAECNFFEPHPLEDNHLVMVVNGSSERCGDGTLDSGEECDDGNGTSCDGCSATCQNEPGFICGDGTLNAACGEQCDDGNNHSCDGCSGSCAVEVGWECGDGMVNHACGEQCDDGNDIDGDECEDCQIPAVPAVGLAGGVWLVLTLGGCAAYVISSRRRRSRFPTSR